jgi:hypothetical protein
MPCCEVACATPTIPYVRRKSQIKFQIPLSPGLPVWGSRREISKEPAPSAVSLSPRRPRAAPVVWSSLRPARGGGRGREVGRNPRFRRHSLEARLGGGSCRGARTSPPSRAGPASGAIPKNPRWSPLCPAGAAGPDFRFWRNPLEARPGGGLGRGARYMPFGQDGTRPGRHLKIRAKRPPAPRGRRGGGGEKGLNYDSGDTRSSCGQAADCIEGLDTSPSSRTGPAPGAISKSMPIVPLPRWERWGGGGGARISISAGLPSCAAGRRIESRGLIQASRAGRDPPRVPFQNPDRRHRRPSGEGAVAQLGA